LLHATNLTKRHGRLTALNDVSFSVREGEVLGLIGPNGSGKTTLFECLGGVLPLDGGTLLQNGRPLDLEPILDAVVGTLSKGQRKRALLAIGLWARTDSTSYFKDYLVRPQ
jgi:ABC-type multidrug transport system ATPase subunit